MNISVRKLMKLIQITGKDFLLLSLVTAYSVLVLVARLFALENNDIVQFIIGVFFIAMTVIVIRKLISDKSKLMNHFGLLMIIYFSGVIGSIPIISTTQNTWLVILSFVGFFIVGIVGFITSVRVLKNRFWNVVYPIVFYGLILCMGSNIIDKFIEGGKGALNSLKYFFEFPDNTNIILLIPFFMGRILDLFVLAYIFKVLIDVLDIKKQNTNI